MYSFSFLEKWSIYTVILFVLEWPRWPLYQKGVRFYKKKICYFAENIELRVSKLHTHFSKNAPFISCNIFS